MLACSGWNYNFRCINVVFLRETGPAAKSRTNFSTNSEKATKRLDRLAPKLAHMCRFIWGWIYSKTNCPSRHKVGTWEVLGGQQFNVWGSCQTAGPIGTTLVHVCRFSWEWTQAKYKSALNNPGGIWGGGFRGSQIKKSWEAVKRLDRLAPNLVHVCGFVWEWTSAKYNSPLHTPGALGGGGGGFRGSQIQKCWEAVKRRSDRLAHECRFIWEWIYAKQIAPRNTWGF